MCFFLDESVLSNFVVLVLLSEHKIEESLVHDF